MWDFRAAVVGLCKLQNEPSRRSPVEMPGLKNTLRFLWIMYRFRVGGEKRRDGFNLPEKHSFFRTRLR